MLEDRHPVGTWPVATVRTVLLAVLIAGSSILAVAQTASDPLSYALTTPRPIKIIKQLRADGVLEFHRGHVTVLDECKLEELAHFDDRYLHLTPSR